MHRGVKGRKVLPSFIKKVFGSVLSLLVWVVVIDEREIRDII